MSKKKQEQFDDTLMAVKDELCVWTRVMDEALLDGLIEQSKLGNRVGGTFTTQAYDNLTAELKEKFPNKRLDKQKIVNHFKNMKKKFGPWYDIFKDGPSGFGYDPITGIWEAEPEVWEKLIEAKPEAAKYRNKAFPLYDKLAEIYGVDRAIGDRAETAAEMRAKKKASQPQCVDSIEEVDLLVSQNEILLENIATDSVNVSRQKIMKESAKESASPLEATAENCGAETSSKKAKTKSKVSDDELEVLRNGFDTVANALMKSTAELVKPTRLVIEESDVWLLLEEIGLVDDAIAEGYVFLMGNPDKLKALLASPEAKRKDVLKIMMRMSKATM